VGGKGKTKEQEMLRKGGSQEWKLKASAARTAAEAQRLAKPGKRKLKKGGGGIGKLKEKGTCKELKKNLKKYRSKGGGFASLNQLLGEKEGSGIAEATEKGEIKERRDGKSASSINTASKPQEESRKRQADVPSRKAANWKRRP